MILNRFAYGLVFAAALLCSAMVHAQGYPNSPVFRGYRSEEGGSGSRNDGLRRQINVFLLERDAANGDPLAQHELAVRLLTGRGIAADTPKSAYWMQKAAAQELPPAMYNYALLLNNGRGVEWNPFKAYRLFRAAAEKGMTEARHVTGIFFTDGLVVPQNWDSAWVWISGAAKAGYEPAIRAKKEILARGLVRLRADSTLDDSGHASAVSGGTDADESAGSEAGEAAGTSNGTLGSRAGHVLGAWSLLFLDFDREKTPTAVSTENLFEEFLASCSFTAADSTLFATLLEDAADTAAWHRLTEMAAWGNPEALALLGRFYDEGRHVDRDRMTAAVLFVSGIYLESPRAPALLMQLLRESDLPSRLPDRAWGGDPRAQYVWASLKAMDLDTRLSDAEAFNLLGRAAASGFPAAIVQAGICHATGRWVKEDMGKAEALWARAAAMGMEEARLRLAAASILGQGKAMTLPDALLTLEDGARQGSLIAQVALASSYERGVGRSVDTGEAARRYHECAVRGSRTGWRSLKRMYDERRPYEAMFRVNGD